MSGVIIINSVPKCGSNLMGGILETQGWKRGKLGLGGGYLVRDNDMKRFCYEDGQGIIVGVTHREEWSMKCIDKYLSQMESGSYYVSHCDTGIWDKYREYSFTVLMAIRHPLAVINSKYHYIMNPIVGHAYRPQFARMTERDRWLTLIEGNYRSGPLGRHSMIAALLAVYPYYLSQEVTVARYEDLIEGNYDALDYFIHQPVGDIPKSEAFRKGEVDSYKEEMPLWAQNLALDKLGGVMDLYGYE